MEYKMKIGDRVLPCDVEVENDHGFTAVFKDKAHRVEHTAVSGNQIHLNIDGRCVNVYVAGAKEGKTVVVDGTPYFVQDADLIERGGYKRRDVAEGPQEVTPPMPSVVVRVLVTTGDDVEKGDAVIVVSAMKMETTLNAPHQGRVTAIHAAEGDKVAPGQVLVDIEKGDA